MILKKRIEKSSRSYKVSELIRKAISSVLIKNELPLDESFNFPINVVRVEMNSDLKIAYIYVISHESFEENQLLERLDSCKHYLSKEVAKLISLKFVPKLVFRNDESVNYINKLEKILNNEKVSKDIKKL